MDQESVITDQRPDTGSQRSDREQPVDLSVRIGSLTLRNPLMSASGCFGYGVEYADAVDLSTPRRPLPSRVCS